MSERPTWSQLQARVRALRECYYEGYNGYRPRVHGNGFLQLDLSTDVRLHIFGHDKLPKQHVATPIHDHTFGFKSYCYKGRLVNVVYGVEPGGVEFHVYEPEVRDGEDTVLMPVGAEHDCGVFILRTNVVVPAFLSDDDCVSMRASYSMECGVLHESLAPEPTVTVMFKASPTQPRSCPWKPRVLVPQGMAPDNEFTRYDVHPDLLWEIIDEMLEI